MITIIGDTSDELANIQDMLDSGILNLPPDEQVKIKVKTVNFKLSSGNILLVNQYNHIVGEKQPSDNKASS